MSRFLWFTVYIFSLANKTFIQSLTHSFIHSFIRSFIRTTLLRQKITATATLSALCPRLGYKMLASSYSKQWNTPSSSSANFIASKS